MHPIPDKRDRNVITHLWLALTLESHATIIFTGDGDIRTAKTA